MQCLYKPSLCNAKPCNYDQPQFYKKCISFLITIISFIGALYFFVPKISITALDPLTADDPFPSTFVIKNESELPIKNIIFTFNLIDIKYENPTFKVTNNEITPTTIKIGSLAPSEMTSQVCINPISLGAKIIFSDIEVIITYKPILYFRNQHKKQRFVTQIRDGKFIWIPKAITKK